MNLSIGPFSIPSLPQIPIPAFLKQVVGGALVIRSGEVLLLSMRGPKVVSRVRVPIEGTETQHLAQAVQKALSTAALKTKRLAVAVPPQDVLFRFFTVPMVPKTEWDSVVQFEARKYIPFKIDTLIWDYRVVPSKGSNKLEVVFAAIQREAFRRIHDVLVSSGIQTIVVEPTTLSLARLVATEKNKPATEFVCIVDLEQDRAHIAIIKDQTPYLTRDCSLQASPEMPTLPQAPQAGLEGPIAEAGGVTAPVPADSTSIPPAASAQPDMDQRAQRLLTELSVSMDFFTREYPSTQVAKVILFGEETLVGPWCRALSDRLRCSVELGSGLVAQHVPAETPLSFASAVGLIAGTRDQHGFWLDFLKRAPVKAPTKTSMTAQAKATTANAQAKVLALLKTPKAMVMGALFAGLLACFAFMQSQDVAAVKSRLGQLMQSRSKAASQLAHMSPADVKSLKDKATNQLALLKHMIDQRMSVAAKLDALVRILPDGVWFMGLTFEDRPDAAGRSQPRLSLNGACFLGDSAKELSAIQQLEEQVKRSEALFRGFQMARVGQITVQTNAQQEYTFQTFQLDCNSSRNL